MEISSQAPLSGLRVVEVCDDLGEYGGRLLAGLGADVVKVIDSGNELKRYPHRADFLRYGKRVVERYDATGNDTLLEFVGRADVVLVNKLPSWLDDAKKANPALIIVSTTPFGLSGPYSDFVGNDLTALAMGGLLGLVGWPSRPPTRLGGNQAWDTTGAAGAIGALLALRRRPFWPTSQLVEVTAQETVTMATENAIGFLTLMDQVRTRAGGASFAGASMTHACKDGMIVGYLARRWDSFLDWLDHEGVPCTEFRLPPWDDYEYRLAHNDVVEGLVLRLFSTMTGEEVFDGAQRHRIIMSPVRRLKDVRYDPQVVSRGFFIPLADGSAVMQPGKPYILRPGPEPSGQIAAPGMPTAKQSPPATLLPLTGLRVIDLGTNIAAPLVTKFLALYGADVLRVESSRHVDSLRTTPVPRPPGRENDGNVNWLWANTNPGKRSLVLDLGTKRGREIFLDLVRRVDVVVDNYGVDPMPKWQLTFDDLVKVKPDLIMLRSSVMGRRGPRSNTIGTGNMIAAAGGLVGMTGFPDDEPCGAGTAHPDYTSSCHHGLFAVLAALRHRDLTGQGLEIDFSQVEGVASFLGAEFVADQREPEGSRPGPMGNRASGYRLHGVFPCTGQDQWCAIACRADDDFAQLIRVVSEDDVQLGATLGQASIGDVETLLGRWTSVQDKHALMVRLQSKGIMAGAVQDAADLLNRDRQLAERNFMQTVDHPALGPTVVFGSHIRLEGEQPRFHRPPPLLGMHNDEVLAELGMTEDEIGQLYVEDVIA